MLCTGFRVLVLISSVSTHCNIVCSEPVVTALTVTLPTHWSETLKQHTLLLTLTSLVRHQHCTHRFLKYLKQIWLSILGQQRWSVTLLQWSVTLQQWSVAPQSNYWHFGASNLWSGTSDTHTTTHACTHRMHLIISLLCYHLVGGKSPSLLYIKSKCEMFNQIIFFSIFIKFQPIKGKKH